MLKKIKNNFKVFLSLGLFLIPVLALAANGTELSKTSLYTAGNLQYYWQFENNSASTIGSNNGTDTNISYSSGEFGYGAGFNGVSSKITFSTGISGTNARSISFWYYPTSTTNQTLYTSGNYTAGNTFNIWYSGHSAGDIYVGTYGNDGYTSGGIINLNQWNLVTVTYDGTGTANATRVKVYVNDVLYTTSGWNGNGTTNTSNVNYRFGVGQDNTTWSAGKIDDLGVFNVVLTQSDVDKIWADPTLGIASTSTTDQDLDRVYNYILYFFDLGVMILSGGMVYKFLKY